MARNLTTLGRKQAAHAAEWLLKRLPSGFTVLASPAVRTLQTALALGVPYKSVQSLAPGASVSVILAAAQWPDREGAVIVVGHQPDLGYVAASLLCGKPQAWNIKKGALWWFANRESDGKAQLVLRAVMDPDLL